jgi:hypothetical protein
LGGLCRAAGRPPLAERSKILKEKEKERRAKAANDGELAVTGSNVDAKSLINRQVIHSIKHSINHSRND